MIMICIFSCLLCANYLALMFKTSYLVDIEHNLYFLNNLYLNILYLNTNIKNLNKNFSTNVNSLPSGVEKQEIKKGISIKIYFKDIPDSLYFYNDINNVNNLINILNKFKNKAIVYGIVNDINKFYMLVVLFFL